MAHRAIPRREHAALSVTDSSRGPRGDTVDLRGFTKPKSRVTVAVGSDLDATGLGCQIVDTVRPRSGRVNLKGSIEGIQMFTKLKTDPNTRPRLLGEIGDLSHARVNSCEFKYSKDTKIFGEAEPADYIYQVVEGAVRSHKLLSDGRRQIGAFHLPGDIFGLENGDFHRFTAEAIVDTTVRFVKRQSLERAAKSDPAMVRTLLTMTTDNLQHVENHMLLLGRKTSRERVAAFLLEMNGRVTAPGTMTLPMSRRDIADYLGLTLETVSRALSYFQRKGYLRFLGQTQREIVVLNAAGLTEVDR